MINHPFIDGNKRTGYVLMEALLRFGGYKISASDTGLNNFIISISNGDRSFEDVVSWLKENTSR